MDNAGKNSRDAAITTLASAIGGIVGIHYGKSAEEVVLIVTLVSGAAGLVLSGGWRIIRHYFPWITDEPTD